MAKKSAKSSPQLNFHTFESGFHYAHGRLTDFMGNTFHVEVKGMDPKHVRRHMQYLVRMTKQGQGITTEFRPLTSEEQKEQNIRRKAPQGEITKTAKHRKKSGVKDLFVTIEPLNLIKKTNKPHRLSITIDPSIDKDAENIYSVKDKSQLSVKCTTTSGTVNLALWNTILGTNNKGAMHNTDTNVTPQTPGEFTNVSPRKAANSDDWKVIVRGITKAYYKLSLDVIVN